MKRADGSRHAAVRTLALSLTIVLAGFAGLRAATDRFQAFTTESARRVAVRERPRVIPAVPLQNQFAASISPADFGGRWLVVDFIYTNCPTLCTTLGSEFAQLERRLAAPIAEGRVQLLSISFDLAHDTPAALMEYVALSGGHAPAWQAARPVTAEGLRDLVAAFGITIIPDRFGGFTHNAAIHLVDPQGRLVDIMDVGSPDDVVAEIGRRLSP